MAKRYWLMKSEPDVYGIDDLRTEGSCFWEGVRNYQARNMMRDELRPGDGVLFYHSNAKPPGVAGVAKVVREGYPDHTAFDPNEKYFDPKSDPDNPRWFMVDIEFVEAFPAVVPLAVLQETAGLEEMMVTRRGMRLSIQPVTAAEWEIVCALGRSGEVAAAPKKKAPKKKAKATKATKKKAAPKKATPKKAKATKATKKKAAPKKAKATKAKGAAGEAAPTPAE
ncbi:MAG: hypothetical protein Tsb0020_35420 [Haliangiales bacterium]